MDTFHSYTKEELLALRDKLKVALGQREAVLGRAEIKTVGSVSKGTEQPNDIDLRVRIEKSLSDPTVLAAAKEAVSVVIRENCYDGSNPRILRKKNTLQWPMDVMISDGTWCLCLMPINHKEPEEIKFLHFEQSTQIVDFPEIKPNAPSPVCPRKEEE
jgi:hypothetical protein